MYHTVGQICVLDVFVQETRPPLQLRLLGFTLCPPRCFSMLFRVFHIVDSWLPRFSGWRLWVLALWQLGEKLRCTKCTCPCQCYNVIVWCQVNWYIRWILPLCLCRNPKAVHLLADDQDRSLNPTSLSNRGTVMPHCLVYSFVWVHLLYLLWFPFFISSFHPLSCFFQLRTLWIRSPSERTEMIWKLSDQTCRWVSHGMCACKIRHVRTIHD